MFEKQSFASRTTAMILRTIFIDKNETKKEIACHFSSMGETKTYNSKKEKLIEQQIVARLAAPL